MSVSPNRVAAAVGAAAGAASGALALLDGRVPLGTAALVAAAGLAFGAARGVAASRAATLAVGTLCLLTGFAGLFLVGSALNPLALGPLDEVALFGAATALLAIGLGARRDRPSPP